MENIGREMEMVNEVGERGSRENGKHETTRLTLIRLEPIFLSMLHSLPVLYRNLHSKNILLRGETS